LTRILWLLTAALFLALLAVHYPTVDGPSHVYNAWLQSQPDLWRGVLEWNEWFIPNWTASLLLRILVTMFGPEGGYRCMVAITATSPVIAILLAFRDRAGANLAAGISLALSLGFSLSMGFFAFMLGCSALTLLVGFWSRWQNQPPNVFRIIMSAVALLLIFWTHSIPALIGGVLLGCLGLLRLANNGWLWWLAGIPVAAVALKYKQFAAGLDYLPANVGADFWHGLSVALLGAFLPAKLTSAEQLFCILLLICWATTCWIGIRKLKSHGVDLQNWENYLGGIALLLLLITPFVPDSGSGGSMVRSRLAAMAVHVSALWLATRPLDEQMLRKLNTIWLMLFVATVAFRIPLIRSAAEMQREQRSISNSIPLGSNSVMLSAHYDGLDDKESKSLVHLFDHYLDWLAVERKSLQLANYEAASYVFPLRFKQQANPDQLLFGGRALASPPAISLKPYLASSVGGTVPQLDRIVLFNLKTARAQTPEATRLLEAEIGQHFQLCAETQRGFFHVYCPKASR
jgi:hypothetical protein